MKALLVSVIIPAYNKSLLTVRAVDSVLRQTYPHVEIIVVDDGSTDGTQQAMVGYGSKIKYIRKANGGACSARNRGVKEAKGDYLAFLDCDDLYLPDKLELSVRFLSKYSQHGFVHTAAYFIDDDDRIVGKYDHLHSRRYTGSIAPQLLLGNFICNSTPVIRTEVFKKTTGFDESIFPPADWDMWLRLAELSPVGYIPVSSTMYRVTGNYVFNRIDQAFEEEKVVINKFFACKQDSLGWLKRKALSNVYLRFAQCYFLKGLLGNTRVCLTRAWHMNPLNGRVYIFVAGWVLARQKLRKCLHTKIVRHE